MPYILALIGTLFFLSSELLASTIAVEVSDGRLVTNKSSSLPAGSVSESLAAASAFASTDIHLSTSAASLGRGFDNTGFARSQSEFISDFQLTDDGKVSHGYVYLTFSITGHAGASGADRHRGLASSSVSIATSDGIDQGSMSATGTANEFRMIDIQEFSATGILADRGLHTIGVYVPGQSFLSISLSSSALSTVIASAGTNLDVRLLSATVARSSSLSAPVLTFASGYELTATIADVPSPEPCTFVVVLLGLIWLCRNTFIRETAD